MTGALNSILARRSFNSLNKCGSFHAGSANVISTGVGGTAERPRSCSSCSLNVITANWRTVSQPVSCKINVVAPCIKASACSMRSKVSIWAQNFAGTDIQRCISSISPYARSRACKSCLLVRRSSPVLGNFRTSLSVAAPIPSNQVRNGAAAGTSEQGNPSRRKARVAACTHLLRGASRPGFTWASSQAPSAVGAAPSCPVKPRRRMLSRTHRHNESGPPNNTRLAPTSSNRLKSSVNATSGVNCSIAIAMESSARDSFSVSRSNMIAPGAMVATPPERMPTRTPALVASAEATSTFPPSTTT